MRSQSETIAPQGSCQGIGNAVPATASRIDTEQQFTSCTDYDDELTVPAVQLQCRPAFESLDARTWKRIGPHVESAHSGDAVHFELPIELDQNSITFFRAHGTPEEQLQGLYEPLLTTKEHGLGLGLSIARTLVELSEGRIWARRSGDGGLIQGFTLPTKWEETRDAEGLSILQCRR